MSKFELTMETIIILGSIIVIAAVLYKMFN